MLPLYNRDVHFFPIYLHFLYITTQTFIYAMLITIYSVLVFIKSILKSLVVPVIWLAQIGAIYSQIAPFFALNHIILPANEGVTFQTCGLSRRFRERLRYTVELSSNQK